ncbi:MAG: glycoside hydrolase family 43 protein [Calditrichaceae bacterium]|nr:glycoside hydrolase family 43 protein [Calditrichaceae bacterium]MBN2708395.1 glycoside hydrolase family 43 protein [Calditrichaceae bacterium]
MINSKLISLLIVIFFIVFAACTAEKSKNESEGKFINPILAGFYPDPSICKVGEDYYLVNSTFAYFPGIPVFHSRDLVNWKLIGHVMDRAEQMDLTGMGVSRGIFAPAIRYKDGFFYVTCTLVDGGGNFIVTTDNPAGPWSNPVWLPQINGIDPSLFFDDNGKAYILFNSDAPDNKPQYDGHRTIRMFEFDTQILKTVGEEILLINGGSDIEKKPVWIEGPHIYKKDGYYYLLAAEGGTAEDHSQVVFRSKMVQGPYISYENNPILTQRHLNPKREFPITCTGHADMVETNSGEWWSVFLGCRPYSPFDLGYYNIGRETFLAPVKWINGWPVINPDFEEVQYTYDYPVQPITEKTDIPYNGNFELRDDFDGDELHRSWVFLRTPFEKWYTLGKNKGWLNIQMRPETCSGKKNPSFIARRQQHSKGSVSTSMKFMPVSAHEKAGLAVFQNETHYYFLCKSLSENKPVIELFKSTDGTDADKPMELMQSYPVPETHHNNDIYLKIVADENTYSFFYAFALDKWMPLQEKVDATFIRSVIPRDFAGAMYALYATSLGESSDNSVDFDWFEYMGNDGVYSKHYSK